MDMALPQMGGMAGGRAESAKPMGKKNPMESLTNSSGSWVEMLADMTYQPLLDIGKSLMSSFSFLWPF